MTSKFLNALGAALLVGAVGTFTAVATLSSPASAAVKLTNKELADAITGMQADYKGGRYKDALDKARKADAMSGKPAEITRAVHQMIVAAAIAARDYPAALTQIDKNIAGGEGNRTENLSTAMTLALQMGNQAKAATYAGQLGNNLTPQLRLVVAQSYANAGKYPDAIREVQPLVANGGGSEDVLKFLQAIYFKQNNAPARLATLEQLTSNYPKPEYWHDLLTLAKNEKGLNDEQRMEIYRLRFAVGDLKTDADYQEMAQNAMVAGYPNEAKVVLDKAAMAKLLSGERSARLVKMTNDRVTADAAAMANLEKQAASDATGTSNVKLSVVYWTYGKNAEAEAQARDAIKKGKATDPDAAKLALGHALLSQGKKQEAVNAFNSVAKGSKSATIARMWSIYARRA